MLLVTGFAMTRKGVLAVALRGIPPASQLPGVDLQLLGLSDCGGTYRVVAFITEQKVFRKILAHLQKRKRKSDSRPPPEP